MPTQIFTSNGNWDAPASLTSGVAQAECWGPAGGGGDDDGVTGGNGGGGGAYAIKNVNVTAGVTGYVVVVPAGGAAGTAGGPGQPGGNSTKTKFTGDAGDKCEADFGLGGDGAGGSAGLGGLAANSTGTTKYNGGNGALSGLSTGGGGGSSAGTGSAGNDAVTFTGGTAPTGGAAGGNGGQASTGFNATAGSIPGGAAGGAGAGGAAAAGARGHVLLTWTQSDPDVRLPVTVQASTPSPPPFPGQVIALKNPYGDPPAAIASGSLSQFKIETASPPPAPGQVLTARNPFGSTPEPSTGGRTNTYRPVPEPIPGYPGAVLTAPRSTLGGLSSLPARPVKIETANPPAFMGGVQFRQNRVEVTRDSTSAPTIIRIAEPAPEVQQPQHRNGTPAREAVSRGAIIVSPHEPPQFEGRVTIGRKGFGIAAVPGHSVLVRMPDQSGEAGRVLTASASEELTAASRFVSVIVRQAEPVFVPHRTPIYWSGTPAREAAFHTGAIVAAVEPSLYPGGVTAQRGSFGVSPLPPHPVRVQIEPGTIEPGRIAFTSKTPTAPAERSLTALIAALERIPFAGSVLFSGGHAAPTVIAPMPMLVAGATDYPPVSESFFGWGWRTGTGAPSGPLPGNPITLDGVDSGAATLTSEEECECP